MFESAQLSTRNVIDEVLPTFYDKADAISKPSLVRFFSNVRFMMDERGISVRGLKAGMFSMYGFKVGANAVKHFQDADKYFSCSVRYLSMYCLYFGEDLARMLSVDYRSEAEEKKKGV